MGGVSCTSQLPPASLLPWPQLPGSPAARDLSCPRIRCPRSRASGSGSRPPNLPRGVLPLRKASLRPAQRRTVRGAVGRGRAECLTEGRGRKLARHWRFGRLGQTSSSAVRAACPESVFCVARPGRANWDESCGEVICRGPAPSRITSGSARVRALFGAAANANELRKIAAPTGGAVFSGKCEQVVVAVAPSESLFSGHSWPGTVNSVRRAGDDVRLKFESLNA